MRVRMLGITLWLVVASTVVGERNLNVYRAASHLPVEVRRTALLPLAGHEDGRVALEPVWMAEWRKTGRVEVVTISRAALRAQTGRETWSPTDELPAELLGWVRESTGSDAVVLAEITEFHAHPPLRVGWRVRCVTANGATLWAVDEVFDASRPADFVAARRYGANHFGRLLPGADPGGIGLSPRRFGQFSLATILASLPER